jgi:exopolysaccharide biosynthesis protein
MGLAWRDDSRETIHSVKAEQGGRRLTRREGRALEKGGDGKTSAHNQTHIPERSDQTVGLQRCPDGRPKVSGGVVKKTMYRVAASASALVAVLLAGGAARLK